MWSLPSTQQKAWPHTEHSEIYANNNDEEAFVSFINLDWQEEANCDQLPHWPVYLSSMLLYSHKGTAEQLWQKPHGLQGRRYLLTRPLKKKFANLGDQQWSG